MPDRNKNIQDQRDYYLEDWFTRGCNVATRVLVKDRMDARKKYLEGREQKFSVSKARMAQAENEFRKLKKEYRKDQEKYWDAENKYNLEKDIFHKEKNIYNEHSLNFSLKYLRYNLEPYQVKAFARFVTIFSLLGMILISALSIVVYRMLYSSPPGFLLGAFLLTMVFVLPLTLSRLVLKYPVTMAKRVQINTLGRLPEVINYMSMSMSLNPSLNIAVEFAADNMDEPLKTQMKRIIWNVYIRKFDSIESSFLEFASFCGRFNEEFKRSLYGIRNSALEKTQAGIDMALNTANNIILDGTKQHMLTFANSLTGPTMVLFSLGILLPMIIGTMLPLLQVGSDSIPIIVLLMDVIFPGVTFTYAYHILGSRPGTSSPPDIPFPLSRRKYNTIIALTITLILAGVVGGTVAMVMVNDETNPLLRSLSPFPIILGIGLGVVYYCHTTTRHQKKKRDWIVKMEREFPDALYHMGSRIAEGKSFEEAVSATSRSMKGNNISELFQQMSYNLQLVRSRLKQALFGQDGLLAFHPSRTIRASMRTVVDSIKKDPSIAGATIIKISQYLRQFRSVEDEIDNNLSSIRSMMLTTGALFGPIIMGITIALYQMLSDVWTRMGDLGSTGTGADVASVGPFKFGEAGAQTSSIAPEVFSLIIGLYLLFTVMVIIYFCTNLKFGRDRIELKVALARTLPVTLVVFALSIVLANIMLV